MDCSMPSLPVLHHLPEFAQTHVHRVSDAIQPSHPLWSPSPPAFNLPQHHSLFQQVSSLNQVAKVLELQLQHQSFQWIVRVDFLYDLLVWSPCSPRDSQVFSSTTDRRHQFYGTQPFLLSSSHIRTWLLEKPQQWIQTFAGKVMSLLFNMPSRFVIAFLLRNTHLLISWLRSLSTDFGAQEKVCHCFHCFPIFCHDVIREM